MKNWRRLVTLSLVAAMSSVMLLAGCNNGGNDNAGDTAPATDNNAATDAADNTGDDNNEGGGSDIGAGMNIQVVSKGFQVDFWQMVKKGCEAAGADYGATVNFVGPDSEANIGQQIEQLQNAINMQPDGLCFAPLDPASALDLIKQAGSDGLPIVTFDATFDEAEYPTEGAVRAFVATDNIAAGATAAQEMYDKLGARLTGAEGTVRIAVMSQDTTSESVHQRNTGFINKMVELCGADVTSVEGHDKYAQKVDGAKVIIDVGIPAETTDAAGQATAQNLLNNDDLIGFYGSNEFSAKAAVNANQGLNKLGTGDDNVIGIGFDSGALQKDAIRNGTLYGAITQDPQQIGYLVVENVIKSAAGETVSDVAVPYHFYTADNIDNDNIASCLYD